MACTGRQEGKEEKTGKKDREKVMNGKQTLSEREERLRQTSFFHLSVHSTRCLEWAYIWPFPAFAMAPIKAEPAASWRCGAGANTHTQTHAHIWSTLPTCPETDTDTHTHKLCPEFNHTSPL